MSVDALLGQTSDSGRERPAEVAASEPSWTTASTDTLDHPATRTCLHCSEDKPLSHYPLKTKAGTKFHMGMCRPCYLEQRSRQRANKTPEQREALRAYRRRYETENRERLTAVHTARLERRRATRALRREQENEARRESRKRPVEDNSRYTVKSQAERQARDIQYAAHEAKSLKKRVDTRQAMDPERYMLLDSGEYMLLAAKCQRCKKGIVTQGKCWTCATGTERTIFRKAELRDDSAA